MDLRADAGRLAGTAYLVMERIDGMVDRAVISSLRAYLDSGCDLPEAARRLFVRHHARGTGFDPPVAPGLRDHRAEVQFQRLPRQQLFDVAEDGLPVRVVFANRACRPIEPARLPSALIDP